MIDIEELLTEYREVGDKFATAKGHRTYIEEFRKAKLAMLMKDAEVNGHRSGVAQEREALAAPEYHALLANLRDCVTAEEGLRYRLRCLEAMIEVWRTKQADARMERKGYGA